MPGFVFLMSRDPAAIWNNPDRHRPGGRVVMQRTANPRTPVQFRPRPPAWKRPRAAPPWRGFSCAGGATSILVLGGVRPRQGTPVPARKTMAAHAGVQGVVGLVEELSRDCPHDRFIAPDDLVHQFDALEPPQQCWQFALEVLDSGTDVARQDHFAMIGLADELPPTGGPAGSWPRSLFDLRFTAPWPSARVAKLVDARDLKSLIRKDMWVRPPPRAPERRHFRWAEARCHALRLIATCDTFEARLPLQAPVRSGDVASGYRSAWRRCNSVAA